MTTAAAMTGRSMSADLARWRRRSRRVKLARVVLPAGIAFMVAMIGVQVGWRSYMAATHPLVEAKTEIRLITPSPATDAASRSPRARPFATTPTRAASFWTSRP